VIQQDLERPPALLHSEPEKVLFFKGFALEFAIDRRWETTATFELPKSP
jgi:hypothetical protein